MEQIIKHFTDDDLYKFTMCCAVIDNFPRAQVKYTFTDRDNTVYPAGFAEALTEQIAMLEDLKITDDEIDFMRRKCSFIPGWFYNYLKGSALTAIGARHGRTTKATCTSSSKEAGLIRYSSK